MNMRKTIQYALLGLLIAPLATQTATILDVEYELKAALRNESIAKNTSKFIKTIIKQRIEAGLTDDVIAIKGILERYKALSLQKQNHCISGKALDRIGGCFWLTSNVFLCSTLLMIELALPLAIGKTLEFCANVIIHAQKENMQDLVIPACDIKALTDAIQLSSEGLAIGAATLICAAAFRAISRKIAEIQDRRTVVKDNLKIIDDLLNYLSYQQGLAAGNPDAEIVAH